MKDYAREGAGAQIVMCSSLDERFPPERMLDGKDSTFWMTTGMFPQEFVVSLRTGIHVRPFAAPVLLHLQPGAVLKLGRAVLPSAGLADHHALAEWWAYTHGAGALLCFPWSLCSMKHGQRLHTPLSSLMQSRSWRWRSARATGQTALTRSLKLVGAAQAACVERCLPGEVAWLLHIECMVLSTCLPTPAAAAELANRGDRLQTEVHQVNIKAKFLKFTLVSGHSEFAAVNR